MTAWVNLRSNREHYKLDRCFLFTKTVKVSRKALYPQKGQAHRHSTEALTDNSLLLVNP